MTRSKRLAELATAHAAKPGGFCVGRAAVGARQAIALARAEASREQEELCEVLEFWVQALAEARAGLRTWGGRVEAGVGALRAEFARPGASSSAAGWVRGEEGSGIER